MLAIFRERLVNISLFPSTRLCKKPSLGRVTCGKSLRVYVFDWIPAFETVQETQRSSFLTPLASLIRGKLSGKSP